MTLSPPRNRRDSGGQFVPFAAILLALLAVMATLLARAIVVATHQAQVAAVADAAALAGVQGRAEAAKVVAANNAQLDWYENHQQQVRLQVSRNGRSAVASAMRAPPSSG